MYSRVEANAEHEEQDYHPHPLTSRDPGFRTNDSSSNLPSLQGITTPTTHSTPRKSSRTPTDDRGGKVGIPYPDPLSLNTGNTSSDLDLDSESFSSDDLDDDEINDDQDLNFNNSNLQNDNFHSVSNQNSFSNDNNFHSTPGQNPISNHNISALQNQLAHPNSFILSRNGSQSDQSANLLAHHGLQGEQQQNNNLNNVVFSQHNLPSSQNLHQQNSPSLHANPLSHAHTTTDSVSDGVIIGSVIRNDSNVTSLPPSVTNTTTNTINNSSSQPTTLNNPLPNEIPSQGTDFRPQPLQPPVPVTQPTAKSNNNNHHHHRQIEGHAQEFLHHHFNKNSATQQILSSKSQNASRPSERAKTAIAIAVDEINDGIHKMTKGLPKPIPTFTRAHFNTNWITDKYNTISSHRHRNRKGRNGPEIVQMSDLDDVDDSIAATFSSPTQERQEFDDSFDVEKNQVSQQFINCLKLRREFLFTPAFVDRRSFNILDRPGPYEPVLDGTTVNRPAFEALSSTTQTVSVVTSPSATSNPSQTSPSCSISSPLHAAHPGQHGSGTTMRESGYYGHVSTGGSAASTPRSSTPKAISTPGYDSARASFSAANGVSTIASPRFPGHLRQPSVAGGDVVSVPQTPSLNTFQANAPTQLVTTTITTLDPEVYHHIDPYLSAELINSPQNFIYGFVNGVLQIFSKGAQDIVDYQREVNRRKREKQLNSDHTASDPNSALHSDWLRINRRQQRDRILEDKFHQSGLIHESQYHGYCHDVYHLALHQHHVAVGNDGATEPPQPTPVPSALSPLSIDQTPTDADKKDKTNQNQKNDIDVKDVKDEKDEKSAGSKNGSDNGITGAVTGGNSNPTPHTHTTDSVITPAPKDGEDEPDPRRLDPRFTKHNPMYDNLITVPSWNDFCDALIYILHTAGNGPCKSWAYQRLTMLDTQKSLHTQLNQDLERAQSKAVPHRDFYNVRKIDNHVHHSACMNQKHLLRFIKRKLREPEANTFPVITRDGNDLTLAQVFESLGLSAYDLSIDTLDMHASQTFNRFDKFNAKYSPIQETRLREIFLKYNNNIGGQYLAEITREVFEDLHTNKYQFAEYRVSIYGKDLNEWDSLADWIIDNKLVSPNVRWMIQIPRLYRIYKSQGLIDNFQDMLTNIFLPIFHCTLYPHSNPKLHQLLTLIVGFDTVDDESVRTRFFDKVNTPPPQKYTDKEDPHYGVFLYYLYANLRVLNHLRELVGLNTFALRPHAGEAGDEANVASAFLTSRGINHGLTLQRTPPIQYLYYLAQVGISMSPLSNNLLFLEYQKNPFPKFFNRGLNVTLSTDDPLMIHVTKEPLIEEYSIASQVWGLSHLDLCEIAKNSVLQSGFEHPYKVHWLGNSYYKHAGTESNDIRASNLPDIRAQYRWEVLYREHLLLTTYAFHHNKVDVDLIDPQY